MFKATSIRYLAQQRPHLWMSVPVSISLLGIGLAGTIDIFWPGFLHLSWKLLDIWPIEFLETPPLTLFILVAGIAMFLDVFAVPSRLWQRTLIWWFVFFVLWQITVYNALAVFIGDIKPIGSLAAYFGLSLSYSLLLVFGPPLYTESGITSPKEKNGRT